MLILIYACVNNNQHHSMKRARLKLQIYAEFPCLLNGFGAFCKNCAPFMCGWDEWDLMIKSEERGAACGWKKRALYHADSDGLSFPVFALAVGVKFESDGLAMAPCLSKRSSKGVRAKLVCKMPRCCQKKNSMNFDAGERGEIRNFG
ncbi:MAG: hypothetical protein P4L87_08040 [Formivibrio sp.]|nr:hypothetical protein [Formivibrio sp.]